MVCKKCGKELPPGSKFCLYCGEKQTKNNVLSAFSISAFGLFIWLLIAVEFIIFITYSISIFERYSNSFGIEELSIGNGRLEDGVCIVDSEGGEEIVATYGPYLALKKGSYNVTVLYECSDENEVNVYSNDLRFTDFGEQSSLLSPELNECTFRIELPKKIPDFEVQTRYSGHGYLKIKGVTIESFPMSAGEKAVRLLSIVIFFAAVDFLLYMLVKRRNNIWIYAILVLAALMASHVFILGRQGSGHDLTFHIGRIYAIRDELLRGHMFVKLHPNWYNGYGYLVGVFYGDLLLYIPAILCMFGMDMYESYTWFWILINTTTAFIAYFSFGGIFKNKYIGMAAAVIYVLIPYRLTDIYLRAAVGEAIAFTFVPLIAYALKLVTDEQFSAPKVITAFSLGVSGLVYTHVLSCEMTVIFSLLFAALYYKSIFRTKSLITLGISGVTSFLLGLGFILPFLDFLLFMPNIKVFSSASHDYQLSDRGLLIRHIFNVTPSGSILTTIPNDKMPYSIGILAFAVFMGLILLFYIRGKQRTRLLKNVILGFMAILMTTKYFPWDLLRKIKPLDNALSSLQFPWRFLLFAGLMMVIIICQCACIFKERKQIAIAVVSIFATVNVLSSFYFMTTYMDTIDIYNYNEEVAVAWNYLGDEYLPDYPNMPTDRLMLLDDAPKVIKGRAEITDYKKDGITTDFTVSVSEASQISVPLLYYPYYSAKLNGVELSLMRGNNNVIVIPLERGMEGNVHISYNMPPSWYVGFCISIISLCAIIFYLVYMEIKNTRSEAFDVLQ